MKKSLRKGICLAGIMVLSLFGGVMTSYAAGPGEVSQAVAKPVTYNQQSVRALGNWEQQGSTWKFKCMDGSYLANSWIESLSESGAYYFVDSNGNMLINSTTPDGYTVDGNGIWRAVTGSNVDINSSGYSSEENKYTTGIRTGSAESRVSQELLNDIESHADTLIPAYGGLH